MSTLHQSGTEKHIAVRPEQLDPLAKAQFEECYALVNARLPYEDFDIPIEERVRLAMTMQRFLTPEGDIDLSRSG